MTTWTMKDGTIIKIKDMKVDHIQNCINMLEKQIINIINEYGEEDIEIVGGDTDMTYDLCGYIPIEQMISIRKKYIKAFKKELQERHERGEKDND